MLITGGVLALAAEVKVTAQDAGVPASDNSTVSVLPAVAPPVLVAEIAQPSAATTLAATRMPVLNEPSACC